MGNLSLLQGLFPAQGWTRGKGAEDLRLQTIKVKRAFGDGHYITRQVWKLLAKRGSDGAKTKPFLLYLKVEPAF